MKKMLIALPVAAAAYVGAAWTTGRLVQAQIDTEMARLGSLLPTLKITEDKHVRGVFGSTRQTTLDLGALFNSADCPTPGGDEPEAELAEGEGAEAAPPPPGMGKPPAEPLLVTIKQTITHGPLPGLGMPAAAQARYEWLVNGQSVTERLGLTIEGALPTLVARYGFTGNGVVTARGGAAKLSFASKEGAFTVAWPSLSISGKTRADNSAMSYAGELPELQLAFAGDPGRPGREPLTVQLRNLRFKADHEYPIAGQLFVYTGSDTFSLERLSVSQGAKPLFDVLDFSAEGGSALEAGLIESGIKMSLASVQAAETRLGPIHYDFTLAKLDAAAYGALMQKIMTNDLGSCPTPEQTMAFVGSLSEQLPALLKAGPEFRIDRLSIGHAGSEALLSGRVTLPPTTPEALQNPMLLMGQVNASAHLKVPDALIQALVVKAMGERMATEMAIEALAASGGDLATAPVPTAEQRQQAEGVAQTLVAQQLDQALAKNWIVRGKAGIESRVEYSAGTVVLNGQPLDLQGLQSRRGGPEPLPELRETPAGESP